MSTLISFLGVGSKQNGGYRSTTYEFSDGSIFPDTRYIGITLAEKIKPTKVILLGTSGSMWDVFLENAGDNMAEHWLTLSEGVERREVTKEMLQPFEKFLSESLNAQVYCVLIPFARTTDEQIQILSVLADILEPTEKVVLDVTHGFRHLPMLSLVAARFLKKVKQIEVTQIYYGAFEMSHDGKTPILELESLLTMLDWVDALSTFDKDGDYGEFATLLTKQGLNQTEATQLKQAAFFERTSNSSQARQKLTSIFIQLEQLHSPIYNLFKPQLIQRLTWFKLQGRGQQEQKLAREYLQRQDYIRAVIFALEGMISDKTLKEGKDVNDYSDREEQRQILKDNEQFRLFVHIRNALAHGLGRDTSQNIKRILSDEQKMQDSLKSRFKNLLV